MAKKTTTNSTQTTTYSKKLRARTLEPHKKMNELMYSVSERNKEIYFIVQ